MEIMLECCMDPQRHHQAIHEKYLDRRFKRASLFVDNEIRAGFTLSNAVPLTDPGRLEETENFWNFFFLTHMAS